MSDVYNERDNLLAQARHRGQAMVIDELVPSGLDHFAVYAGLIGKALDLGKLLATEKRDLRVIEAAYEIETRAIAAAFQEVERAMAQDFERDSSIRDKTFDAINQLISAGQYEIASEFHSRIMSNFQRPALEIIMEQRNFRSESSNLKLFTK